MLVSVSMASIAVVIFGYTKHTYYTPLAFCYSIEDEKVLLLLGAAFHGMSY